ncbi:MAG: hypothetical protein ACLFQJ_03440 [Campylobacterales bacterium]
MLESLKAAPKLEALFKSAAGSGHHKINSSLPIKIEVVSKLYGIKYMLKLGNVETETKSLKDLQVGSNYWAVMKKSSTNSIILSNLTPQPKILEFARFFDMDFKDLHRIMSDSSGDIFKNLKNEIMNRLAGSNDRNEFWFWTNVLISMQQGVITLPFRYEDKEFLMQLKKRYAKDVLDFYATFPNLGEIEGVIKAFNKELFLELKVQFASVKALLLKESKELSGVTLSKVVIDKVKPLYEFNNSLLDLKG